MNLNLPCRSACRVRGCTRRVGGERLAAIPRTAFASGVVLRGVCAVPPSAKALTPWSATPFPARARGAFRTA